MSNQSWAWSSAYPRRDESLAAMKHNGYKVELYMRAHRNFCILFKADTLAPLQFDEYNLRYWASFRTAEEVLGIE